MKWISVKERLPDDSVKQPIFTRRSAPFKYGIAYKIPDGDRYVWALDACDTDWMEPD